MKRLVIIAAVGVLAAGVGVAIAIAATTGGSRRPATVSVQLGAAGSVLVDLKGRALYRNDQDHAGTILCTGACVSFWKPLLVTATPTATSSLPGKLGFVKRPDGRRQATYNAKPLYTFALDKPGAVNGDGAKDAFGGHSFSWHVVHATGVNDKSKPANVTTQTNTYRSYSGY